MTNENYFRGIVTSCISVLQQHILPDSQISDKEALNTLYGILDNAEIVKRLDTSIAQMPPLARPICFIDLETTGTDVMADRIVEISVLKVNTDGTEEVKTMLINPGIPIPEAATAVHGISDAMVKDAPLFASISKSLLKLIDGCDIGGFYSNHFDIPVLVSHFTRVGLELNWRGVNLIDVGIIYKIKEPRTLSAGVSYYLGKEHTEAHSAEADITATKEIFLKMLSMYEDLPKDFHELAVFSNFGNEFCDLSGKFIKKDGEIVFNFGTHKGKIAKNEVSYLDWMITKGDFPKDTKDFARSLLK